MNITFTLELSSHAGEKKEVSILIRMTQNRKLKRMSTGIKVLPETWDPVKKRVRKKHPLAVQYNKLLDVKLAEVVKSYSKMLEETGDASPEGIYRELTKNTTTNFFDFAYSTKLAEIKSRSKLGTYRRYEAVLSKLESYAGRGLSINRMNYTFLKEYSLHLKNKLKNTDNTTSANLSVIRTIINEAIKHGLYKGSNPFEQLKLHYTDNSKEKLTAEELKRIFTTPLPQIPSLLLARDFFLACFLAEGTRAGDMMLMQPSNVINDFLVFKQQKTSTQMVVPIVPELKEIIKRHQNDGRFLFPFLNNDHKVNELVINSRITYVNKYLKEVAKYCGIFKKLSTHINRHAFTDIALQATNDNIYQVQQSLGHKSVKMTEKYSQNRLNFSKIAITPLVLKIIGIN
jgi:integrase/recombinase XerD